ncbi:hypothetical protein ACFSW8_13805 [Rubritalea tangerina]|uniref:Uncharacterized protein n=1 Tax=Rubritalea tangerina TaxID=430798 RepID=A0ABW4ZD84_9BACT
MNAYEIYQNIKPSIIVDLFQWMRNEERELYKTTVATLANDRKLRPVFIQKKPVADQIAWMHKTLKLKSCDMVGEHLFQVYFMQGQQDLLVSFCDAMDIEHDGKGSVDGDLPETLDADKLKAAVDTLVEKFDPQLVSLYLRVFNLQTENGWDSLTELIASDDRLALSAA